MTRKKSYVQKTLPQIMPLKFPVVVKKKFHIASHCSTNTVILCLSVLLGYTVATVSLGYILTWISRHVAKQDMNER